MLKCWYVLKFANTVPHTTFSSIIFFSQLLQYLCQSCIYFSHFYLFAVHFYSTENSQLMKTESRYGFCIRRPLNKSKQCAKSGGTSVCISANRWSLSLQLRNVASPFDDLLCTTRHSSLMFNRWWAYFPALIKTRRISIHRDLEDSVPFVRSKWWSLMRGRYLLGNRNLHKCYSWASQLL